MFPYSGNVKLFKQTDLNEASAHCTSCCKFMKKAVGCAVHVATY